jgi:hypothetical protein
MRYMTDEIDCSSNSFSWDRAIDIIIDNAKNAMREKQSVEPVVL